MVKVFCFGNTQNGELGLGGIEEEHILNPRKQRLPHDRRKYTVINLASGRNHTLLLARDIGHDRNVVFSCGSNERLQLGRIGSWKKFELVDALSVHNIIQVDCGTNHCLVLSDAGQLFSWGCNLFGQLGLGSRDQQEIQKPSLIKKLATMNIVQMSCGGNHCLAMTKNGEIYSWGSNAFGQLGIGTKGNCISVPTRITALEWTPIRQLAAGGSHSAILTCTNVIYLWGKNEFGQLGLNDQMNRLLPTVQKSLRHQNIVYINMGEEHSAAITKEGGLFTWGAGMYGQLGHGKNTNEILPRKVFELMGSSICQVSCGRCHTLVATTNGRIYSFGLNGSGQLGIGSFQSKCLPNYVSGPWVDISIKDLLPRVGDQSLTVSIRPLMVSETVPDPTPSYSENTEPLKPNMMEIDELNGDDDDENELSDSMDNSENFIIEEPDDVDVNIISKKTPEFLCDNDTIFTSRDHVEIDEYVSDPDSDLEEYPEKKQFILMEIVASKGDQSFVLAQFYTEKKCPRDFRVAPPSSQIAMLDNSILEQFKDIKTDSVPLDILDYIENVFYSIPCWNASYIKKQDQDIVSENEPKFVQFLSTLGINVEDGSKVGNGMIDWREAFIGFDLIEEANNERINEIIFQSAIKITSNMPDVVFKESQENKQNLDEEVLRVFQLLPLFHMFKMGDSYSDSSQQLIIEYAKAIHRLSNSASKFLKIWWGRMQKHYWKNLIHIFKTSIEWILKKQHDENKEVTDSPERQINHQEHHNLAIGLEALKLLYDNNLALETVSYKEFYIEGIANMFDLKRDYLMWKYDNQDAAKSAKKYFLCKYPFIFDPPAKNLILAVDSEIQQRSAAQSSVYQQLLFSSPHLGLPIYVNPYLMISVHRNTILQETINQLCLFSKHINSDFKKPLRVIFEGEEAIDAGQGMKKEFFLLLMKEILDEKYGMFMEYKETNTIWFHHSNLEDEVMFQLIGILCGLAIYNQVIINLPFPLVLYKKLLNETLELEDLSYLDPLLAKNLQEILSTTYEKEEFDAIFGDLNFTITLQTFGSPVEFELCPEGKSRKLTYDNRAEYVSLYWQYILKDSVEQQFKSFNHGFMKVLDTDILHIFHAGELMQLVSGQEVYDWEELESATVYKPPFTSDHPTIRLFWKVFHAFTTEEKKKFLTFLTGSDRIPILGVKALNLTIQSMKVSEEHLPVAHTCFNILDLPEKYTTDNPETKLRSKLLKACEYSKEFALV